MNVKPIVYLCRYDGLGLIVETPSGVIYTNQVGGYGCLHPEVEGVFIPLPVKVGRPEIHALQQYFRGGWKHISNEDVEIVNRILRRNDLGYLEVDATRLRDSFEAWIHVVITETAQDSSSEVVRGFGKRAGIITWQNSD